MLATGKSILDRSGRTSFSEPMLAHGSGGHCGRHIAAGICQVENDSAESVLQSPIETIDLGG